MVGDSRFDRGAAQAAGVHFVGLGLDGDARIEHLRELLPLTA
jgi:phosphoglycolate phosphatase/AHBA synthesis associated protein